MILKREMPSDYLDAFAWSGDERVYKYLLSAPCEKPEDMIPWLERQDPNNKESYVMILRKKDDNCALGTSGFFHDTERDVWCFAYNIRYEDWGKGYATEATRAMIVYVKEQYGAHAIEAECAKENIGSARVMEKLGMHYVGSGNYSKHDGSAEFVSSIYRMEL